MKLSEYFTVLKGVSGKKYIIVKAISSLSLLENFKAVIKCVQLLI